MDTDTLYAAAIARDADAIAKLEMKADRLSQKEHSILHTESLKGNIERVRFILSEFASKNLLVKLTRNKHTALHLAACNGHTPVAEVLIDAATHLPCSSFQDFVRQVNLKMDTALHLAAASGNLPFVKLLVQADPGDGHVQNNKGETPAYIAAEAGYHKIVKEICTTCTAPSLDGPNGCTALHASILKLPQAKEEDRDVIRIIINAAKRSRSSEETSNETFEALFNKIDQDKHTVLELAVMGNQVDVVKLILEEDPAYGRGNKKNTLMLLIYKAMDKEYTEIVELLSETYKSGIRGDCNGVLALILAIKKRNKDEIKRLLRDAPVLVNFAEDEGWTPLHYAVYHELVFILDVLIEAQRDVEHPFVYGDMVSTPLHVAAQNGYTSTLIRLMQLWPASSSAFIAVNKTGRNILHLAAADNRKGMVQGILKYCPEKYKEIILKQQDTNGNTPLHLLISNGCFIPELIKHKGLDTLVKNKENWTPRDMLYFQDNIIADQVQIKIALDDVQTNRSWKFWRKSMKKEEDILESLVLPSKRETKDVIFNEKTKLLRDEKHAEMKKDLERYKKRTNTQIVVTALITTVTFTVGFTMPGGLYQSGGVDEGLVVLSKKTAFNAFMVSDALALLMSTTSLFFYFLESMNEDPNQVSKLNAASTVLNIVSVMAMMLTFISGTYVVLSHSLALAVTVCVIGSLFFLTIILLLIKMVYDRQVRRNEH